MFGWLSPKCPINTYEKTWIERRMRWLTDQLGADRLLGARVLLPNEPGLAPPFGKDVKSIRRILDRVCGHLGVPPEKVALEILPDEQMPGAAGLYEQRKRSRIYVARSQLDDPERLLATLIHELSHELLLGGGLLRRDASDHEHVTDLVSVFLGAGIFLANATLRDSSGHSGTTSWWSISKQGYLPAWMFGYAFALFAYVRGETDPPWASHLRPDASGPLRAGLRYLRKTGDALLRPDTLHDRPQPLTMAATLERLRTGTPTVHLSALWDIRDHALSSPEVVTAVRACLHHRDPDVLSEAANTLARFGPAAEEAVPRLLDLVWHGASPVKVAAARALGTVAVQPAQVVADLAAQLEEGNPDMVQAVAGALACFGAAAAPAVPHLLAALKPALTATDGERIRWLIAALAAASDNPEQQICDHFTDPELRRLALDALLPER